ETEGALATGQWHHVFMTYDGSRTASGIIIYVDGKPEKTRILLDELNSPPATKEPFRIGSGGGPSSRFVGLIDDVRIFNDRLSTEDVACLSVADSIGALVSLPCDRRTGEQAIKLRTFFLEKHAPEAIRQARSRVFALRRERDRLVESFPTTMVMVEKHPP